MLLQNLSSKHPRGGPVSENGIGVPALRILCGLEPPRVALFGKKASQERLRRISALLDTMLNDDDGLLNLRCAECKPES